MNFNMKNSDKILIIIIVVMILILDSILVFVDLDKSTKEFFGLGAVLTNIGAIFIIGDIIKK